MVQNSLFFFFFFATVHELRVLVFLGIGLVWPAAIVVANKKGMKSSIQQRSKEENELLKSTALSPTILGLRFSFSPQVVSITPFCRLSHTQKQTEMSFSPQVVSITPFLPSLSHTKTDWDTHDDILSCREVCILYKWGCTNWWLNNNVTRGTSELYNQ